MTERTIEIGGYSPDGGLQLVWTNGFVIEVIVGDGEVVISGNREGLISLAQHCLTLAEDGVPPGTHVHAGPYDALEPTSAELVIART